MQNAKLLYLLVILNIIFLGGWEKGYAETESLTVFCGSANKPPMEEIAAKFKKEKKIDVNLIFGGSGTLLSQIELSRQGEIYLPGSPDYIIIAERKKLIIENSDQVVAYLVPAIITPAGNPANIYSLEDLTRSKIRVGIGNPESVCLGLYGIELLEANVLLDEVMKNVVTFGGSCSKTANLAALRNVDAILGWRVFHFWNTDRMDFVPIAPENIPRISYIPISIPVYTKDVNLSKAFIQFVLSPTGKAAYKKYGYLNSVEEAKKFAPNALVGGEYKLPAKYFDLLKTIWKK